MDYKKLLTQVLGMAQETVKKTASGDSTADRVAKLGGGAAALGLLSMIFGRNGGSKLAKIGSLAAIGSLAYQAYQNYQNKNAQAETLSENAFITDQAQTAETESKLILQTMIAAAAADGSISEQEQQAIIAEASKDPELQQWVSEQFHHPISVDMIAQKAGNNPALAAQVYLAARLVCADLERKEIIFLANLAEALKLDDALVEQLEKQAGF